MMIRGRLTLGALAAGALLTVAGCTSVPTAEIGDCVDLDLEGSELRGFESRECDEPHEAEVVFVFDMPEGDYPADDVFAEQLDAQCIPAFEEYTGREYWTDEELSIFPVFPSPESWEDADDRSVTCLVARMDSELLTESVRG